jgi:integrase
MSEHKKVANDRPYNRDEIARMLEKADQRSRIIILLMCSSGLREGAIHLLKLSHLEKLSEIYKITVYKNFREEYITFCSLECTKAIDDYLDFRQRYGEKLKSYSPLIREQFDKTDPVKCANPKEVGRRAIANMIWRLIVDSGVREKKNIVRGQKKILHDVMQSHGLRKFFNTQIIVNGINPIYAEAMMGHRQGLAMDSYVKPTVAQMLDEYLKVVESVTIDPSLRLKKEVQSLKQEVNRFNRLDKEIEELKQKIGLA